MLVVAVAEQLLAHLHLLEELEVAAMVEAQHPDPLTEYQEQPTQAVAVEVEEITLETEDQAVPVLLSSN